MDAQRQGEPREDTCCQAGDITVTPLPSGYLIGRALDQLGPGDWWEYIAIVTNRADAIDHALRLATEVGVKAWWHMRADGYSPLRIDD